MRTITFLALPFSPSLALLAHKDRIEPPRALTVTFKTGETSMTFDMGAEQAHTFGELPSVHLMFRDGKFAEATVTKKTAEDTWQDSKL